MHRVGTALIGVLVASCGGTDTPLEAIADVVTDTGADAPSDVVEDVAEEVGPVEETIEARLFRYLEGRFDSADQAAADAEYFEIQLLGCVADAPEIGEHVLYIEQAVLTSLDEPYRQRLYVLDANDEDTVTSYVLALQDDDGAVGGCDGDTPPVFTQADVISRSGCEVVLDWNGSEFVGGTVGESCESTLQGASYATSIVTVSETSVESWDQGWDASGEQVWGAVAGPYQFTRRTEILPEETQ